MPAGFGAKRRASPFRENPVPHSVLRSLLLGASILAPLSALATPSLLAIGSLSGSSAGSGVDLSGLTGPLENGQAGNILGGMGSGLAWAGGNTFLAVPDRGPNAVSYNAAVDDTTSYISRFHTVSMALTANPVGSSLGFSLTPTLTATTLLSSPAALTYGTGAGLGNKADGTPLGSGAPTNNAAGLNYFTGRSDNYGPGNSGTAGNARFDPEGIRVSTDGRSVFVSDEYGPYVRQFDRATGSLLKTFTLPANLNVANLSPSGATEISGNTAGRTANKGMEGLAITPDGKTLVGIMQAALIQDAAVTASKNMVRIVTIDIATGATKEYAYLLTTGTGVSEITAINDHEFLVDERDGKGLGDGTAAKAKTLFKIDLAGATDVTGLTSAQAAAAAVRKTSFVDLVALFTANGIATTQIPSKIEGLAFGDDLVVNGTLTHTLWIANDNDFVPSTSGPNNFYVLGVTDADLGGSVFQAQAIAQAVPEPGTIALMATGLLGMLGLRRRRS